MKSNSVCVLGSTGFVGGGFLEYFNKYAYYPTKQELYKFDLNKYKYIINCVGMSNQASCEADAISCYTSNVLIPSIISRTTNQKIIHISSTLSGQGSFYSLSKQYIDEYIYRTSKNFTIYRLPWLFNLDEGFQGYIINCILKNEKATIYSEVGSPSYLPDIVKYISEHLDDNTNSMVDLSNKGHRVRDGWAEDIAKEMGMELDYQSACREYEHKYDSRAFGIELRPYEQALKESIECVKASLHLN